MKFLRALATMAAISFLASPAFAQAQGGYIDTNVTIVITTTSLIKSAATVSYLHPGNEVVCIGANCQYEMKGNHRIMNDGNMNAGITFRTNRWQYRGTLNGSGSAGELGVSATYHRSGKKDQYGNEFRYKGEVRFSNGTRHCYDIYLVTAATDLQD